MTLSLVPMPTSRLVPLMRRSTAEYEKSRVLAGETPEQAAEAARRSFGEAFPDGAPAEGHLVYDVIDDARPGEPVGILWIAPRVPGSSDWWVFDVEIDEAHRGAGLGRATMLLAEQAAARHGAETLGLNVFGYNEVARHLYESLGYETTAVQMKKPVTA
ncbi:N-acetyltransferase [Frigoribacterium sp. PhB118]|uniref:GNAT family N-acetyltransferase n=1 Tax=Frigoribacterium sp. PhB118 TaxID=2485175 RepID=UPI000F464688|nr:GNAT family N-acetyltransferase [Frigoribacterium sp. PhB118]ROS53836.1 ribosomal protein S18 acetylase RimI-like enzyme [Frigoribacterium sp. PhB118]